ncbi:MAG: hypothetical protein NTX23_07835 [Candidatus Bipolaricaulota bacterium]|nr:hypothetical protein [Candidatus Bipolaricaulota bacterium]
MTAAGLAFAIQIVAPRGALAAVMYTIMVAAILAALVAVLLLPDRTRRRLRQALFYLLSDPSFLSVTLSEADQIKRRFNELVQAYHMPALEKADAEQATLQIQKELLERLERPLRENYELTYRLSLRPPVRGTRSVELGRKVGFRAHNYIGHDDLVFGQQTFFAAVVDTKDDLAALNLPPTERVDILRVAVDGSELVIGQDYTVERTTSEDRITVEGRCQKRFEPDRATAHVEYETRSVVPVWDYSVFSVISVVRSLVLRVNYNPAELQVKCLAMVPGVARLGREVKPGELEIDLTGRILIPTQSILLTWRPIQNNTPG